MTEQGQIDDKAQNRASAIDNFIIYWIMEFFIDCKSVAVD